jgi:hypothetical protein
MYDVFVGITVAMVMMLRDFGPYGICVITALDFPTILEHFTSKYIIIGKPLFSKNESRLIKSLVCLCAVCMWPH